MTAPRIAIARPEGASSRWTPNLGADVLLLRTLVPDVMFAILELVPEGCDINVEELDANEIAKLVWQYNVCAGLLNKTVTDDGADVDVVGITVMQHPWGVSLQHDNQFRLLVVPDAQLRHAQDGLTLTMLRPEEVGCAFCITSPGIRPRAFDVAYRGDTAGTRDRNFD